MPSGNRELPRVSVLPVQLDGNDTTRTEIVQVVIAWLLEQGYTASAYLLREEATDHLRDEHNERKAVRAICLAIEDRQWDVAHKQVRKLLALKDVSRPTEADKDHGGASVALYSTLPFLISQQQLLELVGEDDGQRAFTFFARHIKPHENSISREHILKLSYLLTCKSVSEAATLYPEYRGWTPKVGRAKLLQVIHDAMRFRTMQSCCQPSNCNTRTSISEERRLEVMLAKALSFEVVCRRYPRLSQGMKAPVKLSSLFAPLGPQLPPTDPLLTIDVNALRPAGEAGADGKDAPLSRCRYRLTACQPFFDVPAVAAGSECGHVLWVPLEASEPAPTGDAFPPLQSSPVIYRHLHHLHGMVKHARKLLCWGGPQAVILDTSAVDGVSYLTRPSSPEEVVSNIFTHNVDVHSGCFFPCGTIVASGLSEGTVTLWDAQTGAKMLQHKFSEAAIVSLLSNRIGTSYFTASKDGIIHVVDVATGVLMHSLCPPIRMELSSIALSPSTAYLAAAYRGGTVRLWNVLTGEVMPHCFRSVENNARMSVPMCFGEVDAHIFCGNETGTITFWNVVSLTTSTAKDAGGIRTSSLAVSSGDVLAPYVELPTHRGSVRGIHSEKGYCVSCGDDGVIAICSNKHHTLQRAVTTDVV